MTRTLRAPLAATMAIAAACCGAPSGADADALTVARPDAQAPMRPATLPAADGDAQPGAEALTPEAAGAFARKRNYFPYSAATAKKAGAKAGADKIVGGVKAAQGAYPFQVALLRVRRTGPDKAQVVGQFCAGTLITSRYVLTAAHCFVQGDKGKVEGLAKADTVGVHVGDVNIANGGDKILVKRIVVHPKYVTGANVNDIAIVELDRPPRDESGAKTVTIVDRPSEGRFLPLDGELRIIGWGKTEAGKGSLDLMQADIAAVDRGQCNRVLSAARMNADEVRKALNDLSFEFNLGPAGRKALEADIVQQGGAVTPQMFCAAAKTDGRDTCGGDSGGPILRRDAEFGWVQVGIVSFGVGSCGQAALPGVYTRLALYTDWIRSVVEAPAPAGKPAPTQ
jgi:secreted trypsin-like serine protease